MATYKALMLDLDGTTIPNARQASPSAKVVKAIAKAKNFLQVCAVTGRSYPDAKRVANELALDGPSIVMGGGQIVDFVTDTILWERALSLKDTEKICVVLQQYKQPFFIAYKDQIDHPHTQLSLLSQKPAITIAIPDLSAKQTDVFLQELKNFSSISVHKIIGWKKGTYWIQINHAAASKQYAIVEIAKRLQIDTHEIIGAGDGPNDFPLLMSCGLKVAMGNATDDLKAIADYIAPTVEEDGVADVIEKFVLC